ERRSNSRVIGPVPAPNSTTQRARLKSMPWTVAAASQGELGARAAIRVPWVRNLPKNNIQSGKRSGCCFAAVGFDVISQGSVSQGAVESAVDWARAAGA